MRPARIVLLTNSSFLEDGRAKEPLQSSHSSVTCFPNNLREPKSANPQTPSVSCGTNQTDLSAVKCVASQLAFSQPVPSQIIKLTKKITPHTHQKHTHTTSKQTKNNKEKSLSSSYKNLQVSKEDRHPPSPNLFARKPFLSSFPTS